jgi:hypothetical protein
LKRWLILLMGLLSSSVAPGADRAVTLTWEDLLPEGELEHLLELYEAHMDALDADPVLEGSPEDQMVQIGTFNVVEHLDGERVRMPGYVIPFEFEPEGGYREFLLVPYFGACIHVPPPPPNQLVWVTADPPVDELELWDPVWIEGVMGVGRFESELADAAYTIELERVEPFEE